MTSSQQLPRIAAAAAAALGFSLIVLVPGERKLKSARGEARSLLDGISAESMRYDSLAGLFHEVQSLRAGMRDFESHVPPDHHLGDFLRDLGKILTDAGMENHILQPRQVQNITAQQIPPGCVEQFADLQIQPVLVQCEGKFEGLFSAMRDLEAMPRISRVVSLKLTGDPQHPGRVKVEMLLNTYFLPPKTSAGAKTP